MQMNLEEFNAMRRHVRRICGIDLGEDKAYLVEQRFATMAQVRGFTNMGQLVQLIEQDFAGRLREEITDAITTNETSFFRDDHPFQAFRNFILPDLTELVEERKGRSFIRKGAKVSILSAGASTGQEAYCLSMLIHDRFPFHNPDAINADDFVITGGDIDTKVLAKAMGAEYTNAEIARGLPDLYRDRYFTKTRNAWVVNPKVRSIVEFRSVNFTEPFVYLGGFDCIFCRNILIYFDQKSKIDILEQFFQILSPNGFLVLGATESLYGLTQLFQSNHVGESIVYRKI